MTEKIREDVASERIVLSGIFRHGKEALLDISDIITTTAFTQTSNQIIFKCMSNVLEVNNTIDIPSLLASSTSLGLYDTLNNKDELEYINSLGVFPTSIESVRPHAIKLKKLEIARTIQARVKDAYTALNQVTGDESIDEIISLAESPIFDISNDINKQSEERTVKIFNGGVEYIDWLRENKTDQIGIGTGFDRYDEAIGGGLRAGSVDLIVARIKVGKMQPLDSVVYTPKGPKLMGDIQVGDKVCTPFGNNAIVDGIFPHGKNPVYKVTFNDGDAVECGLDHLWHVKHRRHSDKNNNPYKIKSLSEILESNILESSGAGKWQVPLPKPVMFNKRDQLIDPYVMGCLLGDGSFRGSSVTLTNVDEELLQMVKSRLIYGYYLSKKGDSISYTITKGHTGGKTNDYIESVKNYGLWNKTSHEKFIPKNYLYSNIEDRMLILAGLLDTDGSVDKRGNVEYSTVSKLLANDVKTLVNSLGGLTTIRERYTSYEKGGKKFKSFRLNIKFNDNGRYFLLTRKIDRCHKRVKGILKRSIIKIEQVKDKECQCIHIDDKDHLYITDNFIVTHNTTCAKEVAIKVAKDGIPVLMIDTEMSKHDQINRSIASGANVLTGSIETGKFDENPESVKKVYEWMQKAIDLPYYYRSVAGKPFEEILSIIRRWLFQDVGMDENGNVLPCVVIYDYFKLMDESVLDNMQEYQAMGFQISKMTDCANQYKFSCLAFVQANRDGITKETSDIVSQSDRLVWACGSLFLLREKTDEEQIADGIGNGNLKLVHICCRYGPGLDGDYINIFRDGNYSIMKELTTQKQALKSKAKGEIGFESEDVPFD